MSYYWIADRRRSPCGERGLKCFKIAMKLYDILRSLPVRGAWVEIRRRLSRHRELESLPVRGAWVEIATVLLLCCCGLVAPRAGSVG